MNKAVFESSWQQVRGRTREWWGRLTDGDLDRTRQLEGFISRLQQRHGFSRERAAKELRRRMERRESDPTAPVVPPVTGG